MMSSILQKLQSPIGWAYRISFSLTQFESKTWFYFATYTLLFFLNCLWNWDAFQEENFNLLTSRHEPNTLIPFWKLYPFQILSIYFLAFTFVTFTSLVLFLLSYAFRLESKKQAFPIVNISFRSFFMFFCILFLGNKILGFFHSYSNYGMVLFAYWMILLSFFVQFYAHSVSNELAKTNSCNPRNLAFISYFLPLSYILMVLVILG
ncbi:hypothetical protein [Leptospira jelokensis]|uniref:Yip1 domain-containing protein n=1 Tax=Leptospira jelokensis TaxID=2484931 RepID=A0A4Z1A1A6_9LEPT|nr:hypothetical protein [Leptospira jelokensis]TGL69844.1 hypothetical protein EHQ62_07565 [Leptospira jelokensis]